MPIFYIFGQARLARLLHFPIAGSSPHFAYDDASFARFRARTTKAGQFLAAILAKYSPDAYLLTMIIFLSMRIELCSPLKRIIGQVIRKRTSALASKQAKLSTISVITINSSQLIAILIKSMHHEHKSRADDHRNFNNTHQTFRSLNIIIVRCLI